ncbi:MAG: hypothetical protein QF733_09940 [Phycisphaerales bacterium]|jgi:hypothetical protein|nr:hypothetical protein [Phycisphaerales bacterium]
MNVQAVLHWIKANLVIVMCSVVIVGVLVAAPIVAGGMNEAVAKEVKSRLRKVDALEKKAQFKWPGSTDTHQMIITDDLIAAYEEAAAERKSESEGVIARVHERNRAGAELLMEGLFPVPQDRERDLQVLPPELHRHVMAGYDQLLSRVHAGSPPSADELQDELTAKRADYIDREFRKSAGETLTKVEEASLKAYLVGQRRAICRDRASDIGVYLSLETLGPPEYSKTQKPTLDEMFGWQWRLWVLDRVATAMEGINGSDPEPQAAIHAVDRLAVRGLLKPDTPAASDRSFSEEGGSGSRGGPQAGTVPGAGFRDYSRSISGRVTNEAFDVVLVDLDMVVATSRIDDVLSGFTRAPVMSVLDVELSQVDAFDALKNGEYFGEAPVSRLVVTLETLWLREWTGTLMPDEARTRIGMAARAGGQDDEHAPY